MNTLNTTMILLTVTVAALMIPRMMLDWLRYRELLNERDEEGLRGLMAGQRRWLVRHGSCAAAATILVVGVRYLPELARYDMLANGLIAYAMLSLLFTLVESMLAQRIEATLQAKVGTEEAASDFGQ
ncbi:hypothetical protein GURASL_26920 [Geotalea uraniireducens]|uniref:Uncharacterized protein n=1 Tax=Geotalea uraniireducens TaxID=351604 RepID=A0ABN6VUJ9_9BACT|nr:hypothetical protein [Geotalea uraniireducens]BDV43769.1 hypothetical protein GURASL_26920 [Geotalea uraniireducens]